MRKRGNMTRVSLLRCNAYDNNLLRTTIRQGLVDCGFDLSGLSGARVIVKPNLMMPAKAEKAVATHPEFFRAAVQVVKEHGGKPVLAECPGFMSLESVARRVGHLDVAGEESVEVADMSDTVFLHNEAARTFKRVEVAKVFADADILINLPKFKTHGLTYISGAVKNFFGTVPGLKKSQMHMRVPEKEAFSEWLLDLYGAFLYGFDPPKKIVHVMDAVVGQEGEGPGPAGTPRKIGVIITGQDAVAVDFTAVAVTGLDQGKVVTIRSGASRGLGAASWEDIELVGERLEDVRVSDFVPTRASFGSHVLRGPVVGKTARNWFVERPVPVEDACSLCYQCLRICPAGAITGSSGRRRVPAFDYRKCIRCFCCSEVCPEGAIRIRRGRLQWLLRT